MKRFLHVTDLNTEMGESAGFCLRSRAHVRRTAGVRPIDGSSAVLVTLPLHPHLMGVPHRIGYLEKTLDMLLNRKDTIFMNGQQIAEWFVAEQPPR